MGFSHCFSSDIENMIKNMNVENECKDAHDEHNKQRQTGNLKISMLDNFDPSTSGGDINSLNITIMNDARLDHADTLDDDKDVYKNAPIADTSNQNVEKLIALTMKSGLFKAQINCDGDEPAIKGTATQVANHEHDLMHMEKTLADKMKRDKRPQESPFKNQLGDHCKKTQYEANASLTQLKVSTEFIDVLPRNEASFRLEKVLEDMIMDLEVRGNSEQEMVIRIICEHFMSSMEEQMLCHITGAGGMGKSHVVHAIVEFFKQCGSSEQLMLSVSTGCAAILIDGYTLHSLTFLGP